MSGIKTRTTSDTSRAGARGVVMACACLLLSIGCEGGRMTAFDPMARSLSRQAARAGASDADHNRADAAESAYRRALRLDARNAEAHAGLARLAGRRGDDHQAMTHFADAVKSAPGHGGYAVEFADCVARVAGESLDRATLAQAALRAYRYARSIVPGDAALAIRHGRFARESGQIDEAIHCLLDAVELMPRSVETRLELASLLDAAGDLHGAELARAEARRLETVTQGDDVASIDADTAE